MRASILDFAEALEILECTDTEEFSANRLKNLLVERENFIFIEPKLKVLFILMPINDGLYHMHIYSATGCELAALRNFCVSCAKEVPDLLAASNVVKKEDRHIRLMMHRLFKSKRVSVLPNGATVFLTTLGDQ